MQAGDHYSKTLQPHADVDEQGDHKQQRHARPCPAEPQHLWYQDITPEHGPIQRRVWTKHAVVEREDFILIAAIPRGKRFHQVAIANDHPCSQQDERHIAQVPQGNKFFQVIDGPDRNGNGQDHGKTREDGPSHKVRREDGGMPAGEQRHGKIEAHNAVYRHDERGGQPR